MIGIKFNISFRLSNVVVTTTFSSSGYSGGPRGCSGLRSRSTGSWISLLIRFTHFFFMLLSEDLYIFVGRFKEPRRFGGVLGFFAISVDFDVPLDKVRLIRGK